MHTVNIMKIKSKQWKVLGFEKKQRGGNVVYFNDPKQLLKTLELIVGEILAGNTSVDMRNMGVSILDTLLKIYKKYFKI